LLLLDEPLASLDHERKLEVLPYLERLHERLEIPVLFVSHAWDEVLRIADHLTLVREGRVIANGPIDQTLRRLDLPEIQAQELGVVLEGTVVANLEDYGLLEVEVPGARLWVAHAPLSAGRHLRLQVLPGDISITLNPPSDTSILNRLPVRVIEIATTKSDAHVHVQLATGGSFLLARITRLSCERLELTPGKQVWAQIKAVAVVV
jgi:molybdate transport system ATP-binding protein